MKDFENKIGTPASDKIKTFIKYTDANYKLQRYLHNYIESRRD